jgi:DNA polymerase-4
MNKSIAHLDLDSFFVSVERLHNKKLLNKPVLIGGSGNRGVVAAASYEARRYGVHSAMPMRLARELCPEAILVKGDHDSYSRHSAIVTDIIREKAPLFEKASVDEFYLDLTGMDRFFGTYKWVSELRNTIVRESKLPISMGLSSTKSVAKIATGEAKPNGQIKIDFGEEKPFMAPLSIRKIPMIGEKTYKNLRYMGFKQILTLQEMPMEAMEQLMGQNGRSIWKKANALDNAPVVPYYEAKSISTEQTFYHDTADMPRLNALLVGMVEKLGYLLRKKQKLTGTIVVKIRYSNFDTHTLQSRVSYTSSDAVILEKIQELFAKLYERRMLLRLIGVKLSNLITGYYQIDIFNDSVEQIALYQALDHIKKRYGVKSVRKAIAMRQSLHEFSPFGPSIRS